MPTHTTMDTLLNRPVCARIVRGRTRKSRGDGETCCQRPHRDGAYIGYCRPSSVSNTRWLIYIARHELRNWKCAVLGGRVETARSKATKVVGFPNVRGDYDAIGVTRHRYKDSYNVSCLM